MWRFVDKDWEGDWGMVKIIGENKTEIIQVFRFQILTKIIYMHIDLKGSVMQSFINKLYHAEVGKQTLNFKNFYLIKQGILYRVSKQIPLLTL